MPRPNILVISSKYENINDFSNITDYNLYFLELDYNSRHHDFNFSIEQKLNEARKIIKKNKINGIYSRLDLTSLISARLCDEFNLPGPTFKSSFNCFHKYFTRMLTSKAILKCAIDVNDRNIEINKYPVYLKSPVSSLGILGFTIKNENDLVKALNIAKNALPRQMNVLKDFFGRYLCKEYNKMAAKDLMLVEKYISGEQFTIEGFVYDNEIVFTVIADTNYFPGSKLIDNFSIPSRLSEEKIKKLKKCAENDVIKLGLKNTFINLEYWDYKDSFVLIEANSRAAVCFNYLYKKLYGYDSVKAGLELCVGKKPSIPEFKTELFGGQFNINTKKEGPVSKIFNLPKRFPYKTRYFFNDKDYIRQLSEFGTVIAQMDITGSSYADIKKKADNLRSGLTQEQP